MNNLNKVWQGVNPIIATNNPKNNRPPSIYINNENETSSEPIPIANKFNEYFSSVADLIRSKIPVSSKSYTDYLKSPNANSFFMSPTNEKEVSLCISSLKSNKSTGPFSIPVKILQLIKNYISKPLSQLLNLSFSTGCFPSKLKTAKVIPIFKKDSPLDCSNYRPISFLSNIDKIFEKLMVAFHPN